MAADNALTLPKPHAIVKDGVVVNIANGATADLSHGEIVVPSSLAQIGWSYDGSDFYPAAIPKEGLISFARFKADNVLKQLRPYSALGLTIHSDATNETLSSLFRFSAWGAANLDSVRNWVGKSHNVTPVTGAQFVALAPLVEAFEQSVYDTLAAVVAAINDDAKTITTHEHIHNFRWPE